MYVGYFDEVRAEREHGRNNYLVAGLIIPMDKIGMAKLVNEAIKERQLVSQPLQVLAQYVMSRPNALSALRTSILP